MGRISNSVRFVTTDVLYNSILLTYTQKRIQAFETRYSRRLLLITFMTHHLHKIIIPMTQVCPPRRTSLQKHQAPTGRFDHVTRPDTIRIYKAIFTYLRGGQNTDWPMWRSGLVVPCRTCLPSIKTNRPKWSFISYPEITLDNYLQRTSISVLQMPPSHKKCGCSYNE